MSQEWMTEAQAMMALAAAGRGNEARARLFSRAAGLGLRLSRVMGEWIDYNQGAATAAGQEALRAIAASR